MHAVQLCLEFLGGPRGVDVFVWARYLCTLNRKRAVQHVCVLVSSGTETLKKLVMTHGGWNHDFLVLDTNLQDCTYAVIPKSETRKLRPEN